MVRTILEWVYANPALVMNESVPHHPSVMTRQQPSSSVQEVYSMPRTFTAMRSISREDSETSESRKIGTISPIEKSLVIFSFFRPAGQHASIT